MDLLEAYLGDCALRDLSPRTIKTYRVYLAPFVELAQQIGDQTSLRQYLHRYSNQRSRHAAFRTIKTLVRWMAANGLGDDWITGMQYRCQEAAPEPVLSLEDMDRLIRAIPAGTVKGRRDRAIFALLAFTGARRDGIRLLKPENIDLKGGWIWIVSKGGKEQWLPLVARAARPLNIWMATRPAGEWLFPSLKRHGQPVGGRWVSRLIHVYAAAAGIGQRVHVHLLRHSFATAMVDAGVSIDEVQAALGHANIKTTQRYARMTSARVRRSVTAVFG